MPMIKKITIEINGEDVDIPWNELKELYSDLGFIFDKKEPVFIPAPNYTPNYTPVTAPEYVPWDIKPYSTCEPVRCYSHRVIHSTVKTEYTQ